MSGADEGHDDQAAISGHEDAHADGHEHGGDHGHGDELGPIDWKAWGAAALGLASGALVIGALWVTTHPT